MKAALVLGLVFASQFAHAAIVRSGLVGFEQAPGQMEIRRSGQQILLRSSQSACVMKFGPVVGTHRVYMGWGQPDLIGTVYAVQETCGAHVAKATLYNQGGRYELVGTYGKIGTTLFAE